MNLLKQFRQESQAAHQHVQTSQPEFRLHGWKEGVGREGVFQVTIAGNLSGTAKAVVQPFHTSDVQAVTMEIYSHAQSGF